MGARDITGGPARHLPSQRLSERSATRVVVERGFMRNSFARSHSFPQSLPVGTHQCRPPRPAPLSLDAGRRIILRFEQCPGLYVLRCRDFEHEDAGMTSAFEVA